MDPTMGMLIAAAMNFAGGAMGGSDNPNQFRKSFDTDSELDPRQLLRKLVGGTESMGNALQKKMSSGVRLRSGPVQSQPGFSKDPASIDPSILSRPGWDFGGKNPFPPTVQDLQNRPRGGTPAEPTRRRKEPEAF